MATSHRIAKVGEIPPGQCLRVEIGGLPIGIFNVDGSFHAIHDMCTHSEASLCEGDLEGDEVVCPLHFATFNVKTGACTGPPADEDVPTFPVRVDGDDIIVDV